MVNSAKKTCVDLKLLAHLGTRDFPQGQVTGDRSADGRRLLLLDLVPVLVLESNVL